MAEAQEPTSDPNSPQLSEAFLREQAVRFALAGYSLDEALTIMKRHQAAAHCLLEAQHGEREASIAADLSAGIRAAEEAERDREAAEHLAGERATLNADRDLLQEKRDHLKAQVRAKRRRRQTAAIEEEAQRRARRVQEIPKETLAARLAAAREVFDVEEKCWEINRRECDRRAEVLEQEIGEFDVEVRESRARTESLRKLGITKTVAGFLVWAGYLGFAASGSAIAYLLHGRVLGGATDGKEPWSVLTGLTRLLGQASQSLGAWWTLLAAIASLLGLLLLFGLIVYATDWILARFDPRNWRLGRGRRRKKNSGDLGPPLSPVAQLLQMRQIERASFVQLFASVPYVFAASVVFLLLSAAGVSATPPNGSGGLMPNYIGTIYALLATSISLLYVVYISLPRLARSSSDTAPTGTRALFRAHWELAALTLVLHLALGVAAFLPRGGLYDSAAWGSLGLAMTMAAMGLAYGLVYHGLFRDFERVARLRNQLRAQVDALKARPMLQVAGLLNLDDLKRDLDEQLEAEEDFDFYRSMTFLLQAISEDPPNAESLLDAWISARPAYGKKVRKGPIRQIIAAMIAKEAADVDFEAAPEESHEIQKIDFKLLDNRHAVSVLDQRSASLVPPESTDQRRREVERLGHLQSGAAAAHVRARSALNLQHEREEMLFRAAFALGTSVGLPPSGSPPDSGGVVPQQSDESQPN